MIIEHAAELRNFVLPLLVMFSMAQQQHVLNVLEAALVSELRHKTLAGLTRCLLLPHADHFALADFFRRSPWRADAVRQAMTQAVLQVAISVSKRLKGTRIFLAVDDSLCIKDAATRKIPGVGFYYDHVEQRRHTKQHSNASRYVCLMLVLGPFSFPLSWRLYLKRKQVRALRRSGVSNVLFYTAQALVDQMFKEVETQLPTGRIYVLFDSWYASQRMFKAVRQRGWHFICASKSNRNLSGCSLSQWWPKLAQQRTRRVTLQSTKGKRTYNVRITGGRVRGCASDVAVVISKRHRRDKLPAYFMSSDTALSVATILKFYTLRWECELSNWWLKERFGLADFRMRSLNGVLRWHTLIFVAYAFLCVRRATIFIATGKQQAFPQVLADHRRWHFERIVAHVAALARQGKSDRDILQLIAPT
jgi:hypothetical protein